MCSLNILGTQTVAFPSPQSGIPGIWGYRIKGFLHYIEANPELPTLEIHELGNSCFDFANSGHCGILKSESGMSGNPRDALNRQILKYFKAQRQRFTISLPPKKPTSLVTLEVRICSCLLV